MYPHWRGLRGVELATTLTGPSLLRVAASITHHIKGPAGDLDIETSKLWLSVASRLSYAVTKTAVKIAKSQGVWARVSSSEHLTKAQPLVSEGVQPASLPIATLRHEDWRFLPLGCAWMPYHSLELLL